MSSLLNGYKRNELDSETGLGIFGLSATLTDQAEPSESLMATVAWQNGLGNGPFLLCSDQLDAFRRGNGIQQELDLRGKPGSYFAHSALSLQSGQEYHWHIEIMPKLVSVAGFEWGSGFYINPTPPELAARHLREAKI